MRQAKANKQTNLAQGAAIWQEKDGGRGDSAKQVHSFYTVVKEFLLHDCAGLHVGHGFLMTALTTLGSTFWLLVTNCASVAHNVRDSVR